LPLPPPPRKLPTDKFLVFRRLNESHAENFKVWGFMIGTGPGDAV